MFGIFDFISDAVSDVINQITGFATQIADMVESPINNWVNQVMGGVWTGRGADAFVNEMQTVVLPEIAQLIAAIAGAGGGGGGFLSMIQDAIGIISDADDAITGIIEGVGDLFDSIF